MNATLNKWQIKRTLLQKRSKIWLEVIPCILVINMKISWVIMLAAFKNMKNGKTEAKTSSSCLPDMRNLSILKCRSNEKSDYRWLWEFHLFLDLISLQCKSNIVSPQNLTIQMQHNTCRQSHFNLYHKTTPD